MTSHIATSLQNQTIGFIGLGLMGKSMARNLHRAGARMIIHNRSQRAVDELSSGSGFQAAMSPAAVADAADIIILMLTDTPAVEMVIGGDRGIL